jgi:tRNA A37 threonylcarbamoyladenosine dehydratase
MRKEFLSEQVKEVMTEVSQAPQAMSHDEMETYRLHRRFDRMGRLIGDEKMKKLMDSHVMIIGLGGVGSWAAESIVRSGVGKVTLVDFDEICVTNFNRQIHALQGSVGQQKSDVVAERMRKINPQSEVISIAKFYNADHASEIFGYTKTEAALHFAPGKRPDYVIDAIDNITAKCHLLNFCREQKIPIVTSTGSAAKMDPTQVKVADLSDTQRDPLARSIRRILREKYAFPVAGSYGIAAVYSDEPTTEPHDLHYDGGKGFRCVCPQGQNEFFNCDSRNIILGNASFVTGTFGLVCASIVVRELIKS